MLQRILFLIFLASCSPDSDFVDATSGTTTTPTTGTSSSSPLSLGIRPPDLTSSVEQTAITIELEQRDEPPDGELLEAMEGRVSLFDAEQNRVDFTLKAISNWSVQVAPSRTLGAGWYMIAIDMDGVPYSPEPTLVENDGTFTSRFRVGSAPVLRQVGYCVGNVEVTFSELLLQPREGEPQEPIAVFADGAPCVIQPFEVGVEQLIYYQFKCAEGASEQLRVLQTGVLTTGEKNAALLRAEPAATEVILEFSSSYRFLGCTYWHMP